MMSIYNIYYYIKTNNPNKHKIMSCLKNINYCLPNLNANF